MKTENTDSPRALFVVDDYKIRKSLFSTSENLLKKIRKLEKDHADFLRWDQLLYQDWYNLTFRKELQAGEQLERRYRTLSTFHVHLNHVARTSDVSLEQAYSMLKNEEAQYRSGDEGWRFVIEKLREHRFENATKLKPAFSAAHASVEANQQYVDEVIINLADVLCNDESALSGLRRYPRSIYHYMNDIDDDMMERHLSDLNAGYQLFKESFQIAMKCGDWQLLSRIWKTGGIGYQQKLLKPMPTHLKEFLQQIFAENEAEVESTPAEKHEQVTILRSSYRKLARMLHPDLHEDEITDHFREWASKRWQSVQAAYKVRDYKELKRLEIICAAELGHLDMLSMEEIYQSSVILAEELEKMQKNLRLHRKHPAWRFSRRRRYDALTMQAHREIKLRWAPLEAQVEALELILKKISDKAGMSLSGV